MAPELKTTTAMLNRPLQAARCNGGELWLQVYGKPRKQKFEIQKLEFPRELPGELHGHFEVQAFQDLSAALALACPAVDGWAWVCKLTTFSGLLLLFPSMFLIYQRYINGFAVLIVPLSLIILGMCGGALSRMALAADLEKSLQDEPWRGRVRLHTTHLSSVVGLAGAAYDRNWFTYGRAGVTMWPPPGICMIFTHGNFNPLPEFQAFKGQTVYTRRQGSNRAESVAPIDAEDAALAGMVMTVGVVPAPPPGAASSAEPPHDAWALQSGAAPGTDQGTFGVVPACPAAGPAELPLPGEVDLECGQGCCFCCALCVMCCD
uniref:Uncharacterized protein n=1 Tax=Oxyrrhis marina TaxID=2969 RepID=A0A7S4LNL1_OXYMA